MSIPQNTYAPDVEQTHGALFTPAVMAELDAAFPDDELTPADEQAMYTAWERSEADRAAHLAWSRDYDRKSFDRIAARMTTDQLETAVEFPGSVTGTQYVTREEAYGIYSAELARREAPDAVTRVA